MLILVFLCLLNLLHYTSSNTLMTSPVSLILASKLGVMDGTNMDKNHSNWPDDSQLPSFMVRLYNKVINRAQQDPMKAMNLLGYGNKKIFANSIQTLYPISTLRGDFGYRYLLQTYNFNISLLSDKFITGYVHVKILGDQITELYPLTVLAVFKGNIVNLFTDKKLLSNKNYLIPLKKLSKLIRDGLLTLFILADKEYTLDISAKLILYSQDKQTSSVYWQHHHRNRRSSNDIPDYPPDSDQCQKHNLYISFNEIGWSNWVLYPKGYYLNYCYGMCPIPLLSHFNATNHSILQNSLFHLNEPSVPSVCCTPTQLNPLTLIYSDPITRRYVMKVYLDMQVAACGCR
ncbi:BMPLa [Oopsacas minuta]|uniref:BMPLa n=1 Tax=Oopsacas minuta TaxID=111878 RepID=A0AAV7K618_9METZ|nr:BMPLa [Oopsacas minuta]